MFKKVILLIACVFASLILMDVKAQVPTESVGEPPTYIIFAEDDGMEAFEVDSLFFMRSLPIVFPVGKSAVDADNPGLQSFINSALPLLNDERLNNSHVRIRSAASPEGPLWLNRQLSQERRDALLRIFSDCGVKVGALQIDVVDEEYELLAFFMRQAGDKDAEIVTRLVKEHIGNPVLLKRLLQQYGGGALWKRLLKEYFPQLRASRFVIVLPETKAEEFAAITGRYIIPPAFEQMNLSPTAQLHVDAITVDNYFLQMPLAGWRKPRRELLSVKTNVLLDAAYMPFGYNAFCPILNVAVEYYPRYGHFTYGASLDCPWWKGDVTNHRYFQARNYTLESRYYLRSGDERPRLDSNGAAFKGMYVSAYANAAIYGIGWSDGKEHFGSIDGHGWQGEGIGGGLGLGYVLPISRDEHWRLELSAMFGVFATKYDPYIYGCPVENVKDGLYYYDFKGDAELFKKREYKLTWIGPTRVGITISYDLLYRRGHRKGISLHKYGKEGGR